MDSVRHFRGVLQDSVETVVLHGHVQTDGMGVDRKSDLFCLLRLALHARAIHLRAFPTEAR